jgi:hypothetical protein
LTNSGELWIFRPTTNRKLRDVSHLPSNPREPYLVIHSLYISETSFFKSFLLQLVHEKWVTDDLASFFKELLVGFENRF